MTVISPEVLKRIRAVMAIYPDDPFACESEDIRALLAAYDTTRAALEGLVAAVPIACESTTRRARELVAPNASVGRRCAGAQVWRLGLGACAGVCCTDRRRERDRPSISNLSQRPRQFGTTRRARRCVGVGKQDSGERALACRVRAGAEVFRVINVIKH